MKSYFCYKRSKSEKTNCNEILKYGHGNEVPLENGLLPKVLNSKNSLAICRVQLQHWIDGRNCWPSHTVLL